MSETNTYVNYIVTYIDPNRSEGGPGVTRHFGSLKEAAGFVERERRNTEFSGFAIIKQTSVITRERIELGS